MISREDLKRGFIPGIGFDPEFYCINDNNVVISADKFVSVEDGVEHKNGKIIVDGMAAELNTRWINDLDDKLDIVTDNIQFMKKFFNAHGLKVVPAPTVVVHEDEIMSAGPNARMFGCKADISAYDGNQAAVRLDASKHFLRYGGGHIHFSPWRNAKRFSSIEEIGKSIDEIVKTLDVMFTPFVTFESDELDPERRKFYGKAGSYRYQLQHGVEYRTPSNGMFKDKQLFVKYLEIMTRTMKMVDENIHQPVLNIAQEYGEDYIKETINTGNKAKAHIIKDELYGIGALFNNELEFEINCNTHNLECWD